LPKKKNRFFLENIKFTQSRVRGASLFFPGRGQKNHFTHSLDFSLTVPKCKLFHQGKKGTLPSPEFKV